ncbi:MAG: lipid-A-disaccharide synthase-related protein [Meiothermus sp.]|uniref:lipid-A-disaccharide synthase-related protein n=1 Tax=Meiothermus sp. TaxID=1955249 RepID=UPI0025E92E11|nr:lipid-A-disaccharide synthase-related protein [Meiothermus sp.]MCS7067620.1 lipid-A-disaccharide synthase-related protein [Meiothermus sp.]MDW8424351.1 lipid-A-disaccharide synthase-related protein [Meiothermus sp.]
MTDLLIISGGNAEDLIGATLCQHLEGLSLAALPLVGAGRRYEGRVERILGPRTQMPSGGFPFNSLDNLLADLRAGFHLEILRQIQAAQLARREVRAVAVVGDAYALAIGVLASNWGRLPLFHLQPQISHYYWGGRSVWERLRQPNQFAAEDYMFYERWMHRFVRAVYVRDPLSEQRAHRLGLHKARFVGSMAMDTLPPPERDLSGLLDGRPVLVLLPGTRGDVRFSLPLMLQSAALLPEMQGLVAWAGDFSQVPLAEGWSLSVLDDHTALAQQGPHRVWLLRGAFSAILHVGQVAIGTAGTANEQAAGMGIPVVAFPTPGPQYIYPNALRQSRLLGKALRLVQPKTEVVAETVRAFLTDEQAREAARKEGLERNGPRGALPHIAQEIRQVLALRGVHAG